MSAEQLIDPATSARIMQGLHLGQIHPEGHPYLQTGRKKEIAALLRSQRLVMNGGGSATFVEADYGVGKSVLLEQSAVVARSQNMVTLCADLNPDRSLYSRSGKGLALYRALVANAKIPGTDDQQGIGCLVVHFCHQLRRKAEAFGRDPASLLSNEMSQLRNMVGGADFAQAVAAFGAAHWSGNVSGEEAALRYFRADYSTKTEARKALGVSSIVADENYIETLRLIAMFARLAGFGGLWVCIDELVNLSKLPSGRARRACYELLLGLLNDTARGRAQGIGFLFGVTPELVKCERKGLYSYEALRSRLASNPFADATTEDFHSPIIQLSPFTPEDIYVLLGRVRHVQACGDSARYLVPDEALATFMLHCRSQLGEAYFRTPRSVVKSFVHLLSVLEQNPGSDWKVLLGQSTVQREGVPLKTGATTEAGSSNGVLSAFTLGAAP